MKKMILQFGQSNAFIDGFTRFTGMTLMLIVIFFSKISKKKKKVDQKKNLDRCRLDADNSQVSLNCIFSPRLTQTVIEK